ncbi:DNA topoisomerase 3-beta-1 [Asimina triloba]
MEGEEKWRAVSMALLFGTTTAPDYLSESELISLMEKHGIGTDASIPVHINNICERNYVQVETNPIYTPIWHGYEGKKGRKIDELRELEEKLKNIERIEKQYIEDMDALFEAQFSPLADSGCLLSKCGKCARYMKYISTQPSRLYCSTCEEVYYLPQRGTIKLYKELVCPLDNFELLLFSLAGPEGKSFPLCPYCYNSPPFEGIETLFGAMKTGSSGKLGKGAAQGVCACPECNGTLVLDPVSAPKWRLYCNMCNCLVYLPQGAHKISTTRERCADCDSTIIEVDFNKKTTPLSDGATLYVGCILCDELLHSLIEMKHGKSFLKRVGGRGRGRGSSRGRGRRGSGRHEDPKMSFRDF